MSKRKRRRPVPVKQNNTASAKQAAPMTDYPVMRAMDGYINSLAYLGEASPLNRANDYERHSISNDFDTLTILYRENWLAARIIDTPCEDMTRAWYSISSEIDQDKLDELAKLEAKHSVKQEITNAIRWGRLYGGAAAVIVIEGQEDMLDEPLDYDMLQPGCFRGLIVVDRVRGIFPSIEIEEDMSDPEFGFPKWYDVTIDEESGNIVRVHHSRLLLFKGRELPIDEEINADYWGASEIEHVYEELQKRNSTSANIAQLVFQANVAAIKLSDYGEVLGMGSEQQKQQMYRAIAEMNRLRTSFGITLMSRDDDYEQHPYSFAGVAEVYETFMMDMAGAAEIPATKLFGRAPQGMNATGESDMKNYYETIGQLQERILKPALEKLLPVMAMSLWGVIPEDMEIVFEPLGSSTPSERAEIMGQFANPIIQAFQAGLISQKVALLELRETGKPINAWTNISDEDVENAEDEVDQGEAMQDPMAAMGGMPTPPEGGMPAAPEQEMPAEQPEIDPAKVAELKERVHGLREQPEQDEIDPEKMKELKSRVQEARERQSAEKEKADRIAGLKERIEKLRDKGEAEDGGPGSGPRPGYHKNGASIAERAKFMANPAASIPQSPNPQRTPESVKKANSERKEWSDLSLHQKVAGNAAQERHMRKVRRDVMRAAAKGDIRKAKQVLLKNKHYFQNDPASAMKVQSEALQRQKKARRSLLGDILSFFKKPMEDGGPGSGNFNHAGRPNQRGGSAPSGGGSQKTSSVGGSPQEHKMAQLEIIKKHNPMRDDYHTGIRSVEDILTAEEAFAEAKNDGITPDFKSEDVKRALETGEVTIYSSKPIEQGSFVTPSKMEAESYSGGEKIYSQKVRLEDVAWIDAVQGQYAKLPDQETSPIDNGPDTAYNGHATKGWKGLKASMEVGGPKAAHEYIRDYFKKNPEVASQATKYLDVRRKVKDFLKDHPEAENFNTYDAETGQVKNIKNGFCVTFHQNNTKDDPLGGYSDKDYAAMCAIAAHELGADGVNIGYYGNPEVSFVCSDEAAAKSFAVKHNQQSVYNASTGRTLKNRQWDDGLNPIRL